MLQLDGAVDEVFVNVTPLHKADPFIQDELKKLQTSVRRAEVIQVKSLHFVLLTQLSAFVRTLAAV